jgi:predicted dinucleotide-binding enzyme
MRIAVIGAGNIGANAARLLVKAGHEVRIAASGDAAKLAATSAEIGAAPASIADAVRESQIVMLAMPWTARATVFAAAGHAAFAGKLVIDATNPYLNYPKVEDLGGRASSSVLAEALPGARVVKVFNTLYADKLAHGGLPNGTPDRIALPVSGDDPASVATVIGLLDEIGFDAADAGSLANSHKQEPDQPLYARSDNLAHLTRMLAEPALAK